MEKPQQNNCVSQVKKVYLNFYRNICCDETKEIFLILSDIKIHVSQRGYVYSVKNKQFQCMSDRWGFFWGGVRFFFLFENAKLG